MPVGMLASLQVSTQQRDKQTSPGHEAQPAVTLQDSKHKQTTPLGVTGHKVMQGHPRHLLQLRCSLSLVGLLTHLSTATADSTSACILKLQAVQMASAESQPVCRVAKLPRRKVLQDVVSQSCAVC